MSEAVNSVSCDEWTKVTLGDIARNISENEYKPEEKGLDRCIGLEHLDPDSLKIRRWSPITPEMSFTRRFSKGQILFGKRRAYQKKVGLADFDGICSSDILVIEAKKENFVNELLPFILQDDRFFEYAVGTSSGSLSPRTKWKFLSEYEIWLPSSDERRRIAATLWAVEDCIVIGERILEAAGRAKCVLMQELFSKGIQHTEFKTIKGFGDLPINWVISPIIDYLTKIIDYRGKSPQKTKTGIPLITAKNIREGFLLEEPREYIQNDNYDSWMVRGIPKPGDILFTTEAPLGNVAYVPEGKIALAQRVITLCPNENLLDNKFLFQMLQFPPNKNRISSCQSGTTVTGIRQSEFRKIRFAFPPIAEQRQIAAILTHCDETIVAAHTNVTATKALKMKLIKELFSRR